MHPRARIVIPLLLAAALIGGGYWRFQQSAQARNGPLTGSGTIEAEEVLVTAEIAGRVQRLFADEGSEVRAGQELAQIDTALLEAQLAQAKAAVATAEANLAQIRAGTRREEIAVAEAQVQQAAAAAAGAAQAYEHALAILNDPQELELQLAQARANRDAALRALEKLRAGTRPEDIDAARVSLALAQENLQSARDTLSAAKTLAEAQVEQAAAALTQAQARYAQAKSNWEYVRDTGQDAMMPSVLLTTPAGVQRLPNTVSDGVRENYYAQFVQAEAALRQAETAVEQALLQAERARQAEAVGVRQAELQVSAAQAALAKPRLVRPVRILRLPRRRLRMRSVSLMWSKRCAPTRSNSRLRSMQRARRKRLPKRNWRRRVRTWKWRGTVRVRSRSRRRKHN